jgi:hypothetical protein
MTLIRCVPAAVTALALLAGCGDSSGPLEDDQVDEIGAALRDEAEAAVGAFSLFGASLALPLCIGGTGEGSTDADLVPNSVVFVFTVPPCNYSNVRDGRLELSGGLEVVDPLPDAAGFDYVVTLNDLGYRYVSPDLSGNYTVIRNGTRTRTGTEQGLSLDVNLQVRRTLAVEVVLVRENWTVALTPAGGALLALDELIPDASITVDGTFEWNRSGELFSLTVTTPTPLTFDADCDDTPQISAGELRASGTFEGQDGYVQLVWNDCGDEPEIRFVAAEG